MLYSFFWVIPRRLKCMCRRFGTFCQFHLRRCCKHTTYADGTDNVPKRRHKKYRHWGITQNKELTVFRNVGTKNSDAGKSPKIRNWQCSETSAHKIQRVCRGITKNKELIVPKRRHIQFSRRESPKTGNWQSVPKRRHLKFRRRGITQKKEYNTYIIISKSLIFPTL